MLEEHANYNADASRITLLEGSPFARELEVLKRSFRCAHFPGLFRRNKIEVYRSSAPGPATASPFQPLASVHAPSPKPAIVKPAISSYAGAALVRPAAPLTPPPVTKSRSNSNSETILRNKHGQRVSLTVYTRLSDGRKR